MQNCCINCFNDRILQSIIMLNGEQGDCDFCGSKDVFIYPLDDPAGTQELEDQLADLISLYEPTGAQASGRRLSQALLQDWDIFHYSSSKELDKFLYAAFPSNSDPTNSLIPKFVNLKVSDRDAILGGHSWNEFSDYLKHTNRFFVPYLNVKGFRDFLSAASMQYSKSDTFYRARICKDAAGFNKNNMGAPPSYLSLPGRINPKGISELYLAEDKDTALHEVRASLYDYVSFGKFHPNTTIRVVDLSAFSRLSPYEYDVDLSVFTANREFIQGMSKEIAHIMRRSDDTIEYLPTQFIAEFIKSCGFNGVRYESTLSDGGINVCIFQPDLFSCVDVTTETIKAINYEYFQ